MAEASSDSQEEFADASAEPTEGIDAEGPRQEASVASPIAKPPPKKDAARHREHRDHREPKEYRDQREPRRRGGSSSGGGVSSSRHYGPQGKDALLVAGKARILLMTDLQGNLTLVNEAVARSRADYVIVTGNFGFFDEESPLTIPERFLPRAAPAPASSAKPGAPRVGEFPRLLRGEIKFSVPVYAVWGTHEDVRVIGKLRSGEYRVPNLLILDELTTHSIGKIRLLGLGGSVDYQNLVNTGEGTVDSIAGARGHMWTTLPQIGELLRTASTLPAGETRIFVTHISPHVEGLLAQIALAINTDVIIYDSASAPFCTTAVPSAVQSQVALEDLFADATDGVGDFYATVRDQVAAVCTPEDSALIDRALKVSALKPTSHFHRDVMHVGVSSSRRSGSIVLLADALSIGFELFHPGCNFQQRRQYTSSYNHLQRVNALHAERTVIMRPAAAWPVVPTPEQVAAFLKDIKIATVVATEGVPDIHVELADLASVAAAVRLSNFLLCGSRVQISAMKQVPDGAARERRSEAPRSRGRGGR